VHSRLVMLRLEVSFQAYLCEKPAAAIMAYLYLEFA
jgi:hypothetical protein